MGNVDEFHKAAEKSKADSEKLADSIAKQAGFKQSAVAKSVRDIMAQIKAAFK